MALAAKAEDIELELLLPEARQARAVTLNGRDVPVVQKQVEQSRYVCLKLDGTQAHTVEIQIR